jgi:hypothetical protein
MACAGLAAGLLYFAALRRTSILITAGGGRTSLLALWVARSCGAVVFLALAAKLGAAYLLAAFLGVLIARTIAVRIVRGS